MNEESIFNFLLIGWFVLAAAVFVVLFFVTAPYGRHIRRGWGPSISNRLGWIIMEAPAPLVFAAMFVIGDNRVTISTVIFLSLWLTHYIHRAFIYPFSLHSNNSRMPLFIITSAILFNAVNGYLNGRYIFTFSDGYVNQWLTDPRFIVGILLFVAGYGINRQADNTLRRLRLPEEFSYKVSNEGLFRWVSCPNYFGEIMIWTGWAVATWSLPGLAFAVWTTANLVPRARAHHTWYLKNFPEYPTERKTLLPKLW